MNAHATAAKATDDSIYSMAQRAGQLIYAWMQPRSVALFECRPDGPWLVWSDGIEQAAVDHVSRLWLAPPRGFAEQMIHFDDGSVGSGPSTLVVPCVSNTRVLAWLCIEAPAGSAPALRRVEILARLLGAAMDADAPLPYAAPAVTEATAAAFNLEALLQKHEWNLSRTARVLGVTRMTIYNRMRRLGIRRVKVRRHARRRSAAVECAARAS